MGEACTRWEEILAFSLSQAALHAHVGNHCEFMLLNPPMPRDFGAFREGVDYATINPKTGNTSNQLAAFQRMMGNVRPNGVTPLADRLREISQRLANYSSQCAGNRVVV